MISRARLWPALAGGFALLLVAIGSQLVAATYGAGGPPPPPVRLADVPEAERGQVALREGIPVVRLRGGPFEMGRQHGVILRRQIGFLRREYFEALVAKAVGQANLEQWARDVEEFIPESYREELRGLAQGAGLTYAEALQINCMVDRFQSMFCSTVAASGEATRDGEVIFGRNLDFPGRNVLHRASVVLVFEPEGGTALAAVTWPGLIGVLSGMNAEGVAGATMMIHRGRALQPGMPYMILYRDALARAKKTTDVFEVIAKAKRTCANNFMVVDGTGEACVVEFDPQVAARRDPGQTGLCSTNYFRSDELAGTEFAVGKSRYDSLAGFLDCERGRIDVERVKAALHDVARPWYMNVQSMVFLPARRGLHLSVGGKLPAAGQPFVFLDEKTLFGAPGAAER